MVKLQVSIAMELEGVTDVRPSGQDFQYMFNIICTSCREEHSKIVSICQTDDAEISGSRGSANFVWRCGNCKKEHSASFAPIPPSKSLTPQPYSASNSQYSALIALDCRGVEMTKFHFGGTWKCKGEDSGTEFEFELEEAEGRWDDYDEKAGIPVGVSELNSKIDRI